jgi:hypothetical protein
MASLASLKSYEFKEQAVKGKEASVAAGRL